jgi:hypothetical protein
MMILPRISGEPDNSTSVVRQITLSCGGTGESLAIRALPTRYTPLKTVATTVTAEAS